MADLIRELQLELAKAVAEGRGGDAAQLRETITEVWEGAQVSAVTREQAKQEDRKKS